MAVTVRVLYGVHARPEPSEGLACLVAMPVCSRTTKERNECLVFFCEMVGSRGSVLPTPCAGVR